MDELSRARMKNDHPKSACKMVLDDLPQLQLNQKRKKFR